MKKASVYDSNGKLTEINEFYENGNKKKCSEYDSDGKLSKIIEFDENKNTKKILQYSKGTFVKNLFETVECVYKGLLTHAQFIRDAATYDEMFERSVESSIWRKDVYNSLPSALKQKAAQAGYKFIAIKSAESGYYGFRYYNGEWFHSTVD
jgi:hypothetical protein